MIRRVLHTVIAAAILLVACRGFVAVGLVTPLAVEGSSMAPTLKGPHALAVCPKCEATTQVGLDQLPAADEFRCPHCRAATVVTENAERRLGDRVVADRLSGPPRRWDVVVARQPDDASTLCVKRVVGLPGERIELRGGDVYANGRLVRKTLAQQQRLRLPVHEASQNDGRWRSDSEHWRHDGEGWLASPPPGGQATLRYHHPGGGPITDDLPYNQRVSRRVNPVRDLMLTARLRLGDAASVAFSIAGAGRQASAKIDRTNNTATVDVGPAEEGLTAQTLCVFEVRESSEITLSLFDGRALLALDGVERATVSLAHAEATGAAPEIAIVARGGEVRLADLKLWRDVFYEHRPFDPPLAGGWRLGPDEWLLLGDNQAVSRDSRNWPAAGVPGRLLVGRVRGR